MYLYFLLLSLAPKESIPLISSPVLRDTRNAISVLSGFAVLTDPQASLVSTVPRKLSSLAGSLIAPAVIPGCFAVPLPADAESCWLPPARGRPEGWLHVPLQLEAKHHISFLVPSPAKPETTSATAGRKRWGVKPCLSWFLQSFTLLVLIIFGFVFVLLIPFRHSCNPGKTV